MSFQSILFPDDRDRLPDVEPDTPEFFRDLNLDRIISAIVAGREEYDLGPVFRMPLHDADAVAFRHEVMRDLEDRDLMAVVNAFAQTMRAIRAGLDQAGKRHHARQKQRWFLEAVRRYGRAVDRLARGLSTARTASRGFMGLSQFVSRYAASDHFRRLIAQADEIAAGLSAIRYVVVIHGLRVEVRPYEEESDYGAEIASAFEKFDSGDAGSYEFGFSQAADVNRVEGDILDLVTQMHHEIFKRLEAYFASNQDFIDPVLLRFDNEIQFYVAWLEFVAKFRKMGLDFCYPELSHGDRDIHARQSFDLALAIELLADHAVPVCNDFRLGGPEQIIVVTGPNQAGKTTFARAFGQLHYFARLGCPVGARDARLCLADGIFAHFEREENAAALRGKLQDDLVRIHQILNAATSRSIIVINEIFASTTLDDAVLLSRRIAASMMELGAICVWVTFLDELAALGEKTVSMVAEVMPENTELRTFRIVRRTADGLAYALSLARKHGLTYEIIGRRIRS
ncbi:MAG TPA: hypothetical protein VHX61_13020 [Rhizomicrobium sp.]|jgi:hypothetical protein|nr:hypothetical protein [Rhizomicrobium sp.]